MILRRLDPRGRIDGKSYFYWGVILAGLKWATDRQLLKSIRSFGDVDILYMLSPSSYFLDLGRSVEGTSTLYLLAVLTVLSIAVGVSLTIQRLRDIGLPLALAMLFFVPVINILFFVVLAALPSKENGDKIYTFLDSFSLIPESDFGSAVVGVLISSLVSVGLTYISANLLQSYGIGLFIGVPFLSGLLSTSIFSSRHNRSLKECLAVSMTSVVILGGFIFAFAMEGFICLAMAAPIGLALAAVGGTIGYFCQLQKVENKSPILCFAVLPLVIVAEWFLPMMPERYSASTELEISAPIETVWKNVVEFSELPSPEEIIFKSGIAYPIKARIEGKGVGAIRYCEFSTGPFVEPITVWNEPNLLKFTVTKTPPPMQEWSPYSGIKPAHISGFFESKEGQFVLEKIDEQHTKLIGTTWFEHRIFPQFYWNMWSRPILHTIHERVLRHIKVLSEK